MDKTQQLMVFAIDVDDFKNVQFVGTEHSWTQHSSN